MTTFYVPALFEAEYAEFLTLPGSDLPATYKEWQEETLAFGQDIRRQQGEVRLIHIRIDDFKEHLSVLRIPAAQRAELASYAEWQGTRPNFI